MRTRDYKFEYNRRIARGLARGLSRSQARSHPKPTESFNRRAARPISDGRLQFALQQLRKERSLAKAAKAAKISPERLRRYAVERGVVEKSGRRWRTRSDLPRNVLIFSNGRSLAITVATSKRRHASAGTWQRSVASLIPMTAPSFFPLPAGQ